jgi:protein SCO1/2
MHFIRLSRHAGVRLALLSVGGLAFLSLHAQENPAPVADDPHAAHRAMMAHSTVTRTVASYAVPDLTLVRDDGAQVSLDEELDDGRPVVLNFIFTTCTTICPMSSQVFSMLQQKLAEDHVRAHLVSISIDPEQDTPVRLREYAARFKAGADWQHYTGTLPASVAAQKAFDVYRGDKMSHPPLTLVRAVPGGDWVRLEGFATADQLLAELRGPMTAAR